MLITMVCLIQCQATAAAEAARSMARIPKGRSISFGHHFRFIRHPKRPFFLGGWFLLRCLQWWPALLMVMPFIRKHCKTLAKTLEWQKCWKVIDSMAKPGETMIWGKDCWIPCGKALGTLELWMETFVGLPRCYILWLYCGIFCIFFQTNLFTFALLIPIFTPIWSNFVQFFVWCEKIGLQFGLTNQGLAFVLSAALATPAAMGGGTNDVPIFNVETRVISWSGWWQLKYVLFHPETSGWWNHILTN